jgi:hypothetical protein
MRWARAQHGSYVSRARAVRLAEPVWAKSRGTLELAFEGRRRSRAIGRALVFYIQEHFHTYSECGPDGSEAASDPVRGGACERLPMSSSSRHAGRKPPRLALVRKRELTGRAGDREGMGRGKNLNLRSRSSRSLCEYYLWAYFRMGTRLVSRRPTRAARPELSVHPVDGTENGRVRGGPTAALTRTASWAC